MKIAMFTETFLPLTDGIVTRLTATIDILREEGHDILIFAPEGGISEYKGAQVVGLKGVPLFVYPEKQFTFPSTKILKALRAFQPDVVHAVNPMNIGAYGIYYAKKLGLPLVSSYHTNVAAYTRYYKIGFLESTTWAYIRGLHNHSQLNLATSSTIVQELRERGIHRVHLWDRGVDRSKFGPSYATQKMREQLSGGHPDNIIFLYVGRLGHEKGLERLRPALDAHPHISLALVGDGPAREELENLYAGTRTQFLGFLHGEKLAEAYASADVFVFPSTTETLGLVLMEAMASRLPIIAAKSGPTEEMLTDGESALLFQPNDPHSLTQAMVSMAENPELRQRLADAAYKLSEGLDWHKPTQQLLQYYKKAILLKQRYQSIVMRPSKKA